MLCCGRLKRLFPKGSAYNDKEPLMLDSTCLRPPDEGVRALICPLIIKPADGFFNSCAARR